ncbi:hypothetical protein PTKIN_Ptkin07bG0079200 [Pterospermum kingtungense]
MELPTKALDSRDKKIRYTIKTKKLSYWLSRPVDDLSSWLMWKEATASRCILKNVYCEARPGEITAIAGPSGRAGKTILLEELAGMIPLSRLSVHNMGAARVRELLEELGLEHVAISRIGGESNRGISGGEKRRVSIGIDLVHDPTVLLIDAPTSGLDSASALDVALLLKSMAMKQGKTIVLTIHQPGCRILELFDKALLLSSNVSVVHHGSLHLLEKRLQFAGHSIRRRVNVLEFAIELTEALVIHTEESREEEHADADQDLEEKLRSIFVMPTLISKRL